MKFGTAIVNGEPMVGLAVDNGQGFCPLPALYQQAALGDAPESVKQLIAGGEATLAVARQAHAFAHEKSNAALTLPCDELTWCAPVPDTQTVLGVAMNNAALSANAHVEPEGPMFFVKPTASLIGHGQAIEIAPHYGFTFPELELAIIIGKHTKNISEAAALSHVFGYTIMNDVTSQGLKRGDSIAVDLAPGRKHTPGYESYFNWRNVDGEEDNAVFFTYHARSKGSDTFGPIGPWITTADAIDDPDNLGVRGYADGALFAEDSTASYNYKVAHIIAHASRNFTLRAGDIIACGTAAQGTPEYPRAHHDIDMSLSTPVVEIEIDGLGKIANPVKHV